jgi:hypothetical protein
MSKVRFGLAAVAAAILILSVAGDAFAAMFPI